MRKLRNCRSKPRKTTQCPSETFEPHARWPFFGHPASCPYDTNSLSWRKKRGAATAALLLFIANVKSFRKNNPSLLHLVFSQSAECPLSANGWVEAHGQIQLRVGYEDQSNRCPVSKLLNLENTQKNEEVWLDLWFSKCGWPRSRSSTKQPGLLTGRQGTNRWTAASWHPLWHGSLSSSYFAANNNATFFFNYKLS